MANEKYICFGCPGKACEHDKAPEPTGDEIVPKVLTVADIQKLRENHHTCGKDCDCPCETTYLRDTWEWIIGVDPRWRCECRCIPRVVGKNWPANTRQGIAEPKAPDVTEVPLPPLSQEWKSLESILQEREYQLLDEIAAKSDYKEHCINLNEDLTKAEKERDQLQRDLDAAKELYFNEGVNAAAALHDDIGARYWKIGSISDSAVHEQWAKNIRNLLK